MLSATTQNHIERTGIKAIPFWIIGGIFLYFLAFIGMNDRMNKAYIAASSTNDSANIETKKIDHYTLLFLKNPIFAAKSYAHLAKQDYFDDGKKINLISLSSLALFFNGSKSLIKFSNIGFAQYFFTAKQRAPPPLI